MFVGVHRGFKWGRLMWVILGGNLLDMHTIIKMMLSGRTVLNDLLRCFGLEFKALAKSP